MGMCCACQGCCPLNGCDIRRQQDEARATRDGHDPKFEVHGSRFRKPRTSDLEPQTTSVATVSLVSRGDLAGLGTAGEVDHYGDIEPGVESL
jgi:hypothetical protein